MGQVGAVKRSQGQVGLWTLHPRRPAWGGVPDSHEAGAGAGGGVEPGVLGWKSTPRTCPPGVLLDSRPTTCPEASRADWSSLEKLPDFPSGSTIKNPPVIQETLEMLVRSLGREDPLEEGMTTHSIILAWRLLWTEEPGGLQSIGLPRVGHD